MAQISLGSKLNLNGATRVLDASGMKTLKFLTGPTSNPSNPPPLSQLKQWYSGNGQSNNTWVSNSSSTWNPTWDSLPQTFEIDAFPNQDAMTLLGIKDLYSLDSNGNFVIQPRLLNATELATVRTSGFANSLWLSGSVVTLPYGIAPPFCIGARIQLPTPSIPGMWPAVWLLKAQGGWPPEMDILEAVAPNGQLQCTTTIHSTDTSLYPSGQQGSVCPTVGDADTKTFHDYWCVMYNDWTTTFYDGIAVASFQTPSDWQNQTAYMIINYAIAGAGSTWPGALNPSLTTLPPMIIADAIACQMPATYGQGTPISYVGPSGASAISFGGVTPTGPTGSSGPTTPTGPKQPESAEGTTFAPGASVVPVITDALGNTWSLSAAGVIILNGVADAKTNSVTQLYYHNHQVYQSAFGFWWYWSPTTSTWVAAASPVGIAPTVPTGPTGPTAPTGGLSQTQVAAVTQLVTQLQTTVTTAQTALTSAQTQLTAIIKAL